MRQKLSKTSDKPHKYIIFHTIHKCEEVGYLLIEDYFFSWNKAFLWRVGRLFLRFVEVQIWWGIKLRHKIFLIKHKRKVFISRMINCWSKERNCGYFFLKTVKKRGHSDQLWATEARPRLLTETVSMAPRCHLHLKKRQK